MGLDTTAGKERTQTDHSGSIQSLQKQQEPAFTELEACTRVAREFPEICGPKCHPGEYHTLGVELHSICSTLQRTQGYSVSLVDDALQQSAMISHCIAVSSALTFLIDQTSSLNS